MRSYIGDYVPDGFSVGITLFTSTAYTAAAMVEVTDESVRSGLLSAVPTSASGGTNIGAGLEKCQQVIVINDIEYVSSSADRF